MPCASGSLVRRGIPAQFAEQMGNFSRDCAAIRFIQFHRQAKKNVPGRQLRLQQTKLLASNALDQVALYRVLQQFLADHQTEPGRLARFAARAIVQQEQLATNRPLETKNG